MYTELRLLVKIYYSKAELVPVSYGIGRTIMNTSLNSSILNYCQSLVPYSTIIILTIFEA